MDHVYIERTRNAHLGATISENILQTQGSLWQDKWLLVKEYYRLAKPGIVFGNTWTAVGGFLVAAQGRIDYAALCFALSGLMLIMASACVFNNLLDRAIDAKMTRTQGRPLVSGTILPRQALFFAIHLGLLGVLILGTCVHLLALFLACCGFCIYVFLYTYAKRRSSLGIYVGSFAGAVPPVVGYCACYPHFDIGAILLYAMLFFWQLPHFFALAVLHMRDYAAASIPVLSVSSGMRAVQWQTLLSTVIFCLIAPLLSVFGYTGILYLTVSVVIGVGWVVLSIWGFQAKKTQSWAYAMFFYSLVAITMLSVIMGIHAKR